MWLTSKYSTEEVDIPLAQRRLRAAVCAAVTLLLVVAFAVDFATRDNVSLQFYLVFSAVLLAGGGCTYVCWTRKTKRELTIEGWEERSEAREAQERRQEEWFARVYWIVFWIIWAPIFLGSWAYCVWEYGYLLGVGLGWLPSVIVATVIAWLWPLIALGLALAWAIWFK